jgi:hypothetical protein
VGGVDVAGGSDDPLAGALLDDEVAAALDDVGAALDDVGAALVVSGASLVEAGASLVLAGASESSAVGGAYAPSAK